MKVLLVEPPVGPFDVATGAFGLPPPHHFERLGAMLVPDHDVRILDMRIVTELEAELREFQPDLVGVSCVAANSHLARRVLRQAKRFDPTIRTVMGGHHPSLYPQGCDDPSVDVVVIGEGEVTIKELVEALETKRDPGAVRGIGYRDGAHGFTITPSRPLVDLDALPLPARHLTRKYRDEKRYFRASWRPFDSIISSRGCPYRCAFCGLWKINRGKYRVRRPERVVEELETIREPYVGFADDNTIDHTRRADQLADLIAEHGIRKTYVLYGRADTVVRHPGLVEKWAAVGMKLLLIGLESADQERLDSINKRMSVGTNRRAIEICHRLGVEIVAYLIVDPSFTKEDFRRLAEYVEENRLTHPVFTILSPFPGTDLYEQVRDSLITRRLDLIDFNHTVMPTALPLAEFYEEFRQLYRRAYSFRKFVGALFKGKAVLSPRMIVGMREVRRRMAALHAHHATPEPEEYTAIG